MSVNYTGTFEMTKNSNEQFSPKAVSLQPITVTLWLETLLSLCGNQAVSQRRTFWHLLATQDQSMQNRFQLSCWLYVLGVTHQETWGVQICLLFSNHGPNVLTKDCRSRWWQKMIAEVLRPLALMSVIWEMVLVPDCSQSRLSNKPTYQWFSLPFTWT